MVREIRDQSQVESYQKLKKWYLVRLCLTLSIIRYGSRVTWSDLGNWVAPSPTPRCSSYWKGSLQVTLDNFTCFFIWFQAIVSNICENFVARCNVCARDTHAYNILLSSSFYQNTSDTGKIHIEINRVPQKKFVNMSTFKNQLIFFSYLLRSAYFIMDNFSSLHNRQSLWFLL